MKTLFSLLTIMVCGALTSTALIGADKTSVSAADKTFVMKAAQGGMLEVQLGQIAADKASSQDVKDFGSRMVTDHGKANDELKSIAESKGLTVPDKLDAKHQAEVDKLSKLSGAEFDKAYMSEMVKAHKMDDAAFAKEAKSGDDADIKAFADKTNNDVVKVHLKMAEDIESKMK